MNKNTQIIIGAVILLAGLFALLAVAFNLNINLWGVCWGIGLILLGVLILMRPRVIATGSQAKLSFIADINRSGEWLVSNEERLSFVGDYKLDLTTAQIPLGETKLRVVSFVGEIVLIVPADLGVAVSLTSFYSQLRMKGKSEDAFFTPLMRSSDGYEQAERKLLVETVCFVSEVKVRSNSQ
jgi:predicted membrane protein